jgi:hypothetical protein
VLHPSEDIYLILDTLSEAERNADKLQLQKYHHKDHQVYSFLLLLHLTLHPYMGFSLLHQMIPGISIFDHLAPFLSFSFSKSFITSSLHLFFDSPLVLTPIEFQSLILTSFVIFHIVKMSSFYSSCLYIFNSLFSFYQLLQFIIIPYSPSFLRLKWSKYLP